MILLVGLGLAQIFDAYPQARTVLKVISVIYLLYLAWKIANAASPNRSEETGTPLTFIQAALFQWVNPKAWSMALTSIGAYAPSQDLTGILWVAVIFGAINLPCVSSWTLFGQQMSRFLTSPSRLRMFNFAMATLLVATLYPVVFT